MTASQLRGALYGLLVGDALGVPYEFKPPERLPAREQLEMTPPEAWPRTEYEALVKYAVGLGYDTDTTERGYAKASKRFLSAG